MTGGFGAGAGTAAAAVVAAVALLAGIVALELRRPARGRRLRLAASAAAVVGLLLLALEPGCASSPAEAWLLTEGASTVPAAAPELVFALDAPAVARATPVPDAAWIGRRHPALATVGVLGHGLASWDWAAVPGDVRWVERAPLAPGFRDVTWSRTVRLGEDLIVQGRLETPGTDLTVALAGPGGRAAEAKVGEGGGFELRARPREAGRFLYRLIAPAAGAEETLDVVVEVPRGAAILWLESAPRFETREVKRWLGSGPGPLVVRTAISRDRHRFEYHHHPEFDLSRLTGDRLAGFDLIVLDGATWAALASGEREVVRRAVSEGGLGALLLPGADGPPAGPDSLWAGLAALPVSDLDEMVAVPSWPGGEGATALATPARELQPARGLAPLVQDQAGRWLAAVRPAGLGSAGVSLLDGTYRWVLEGSPRAHRALWTHLIDAVARRPGGTRVQLPQGPIFVDEPLAIVVETREALPVARVVGEDGASQRLALRQEPLEPGRWRTTFWPTAPGWQRVEAGDGAGAWFHAATADRWVTWRQARRAEATDARIALGRPRPGPAAADAPPWLRPLPRAPFYLLFLAGMLALWLEERR